MSRSHMITFDMGGTSTDVALVPGHLQTTTESVIDGLPIGVPLLDIQTVGAGGGSIAALDPGGALVVGPQSAGADPGPACYGLGGEKPTVTDAHVVLGRLPTDAFLGGRMQLNLRLAERAVRGLADQLDASVHDTARGIIHIANTQMERALRFISVERGYDPEQFTLVAYGGAGGLHAVELARALGIGKVIGPAHPGVFSAWGMSVADVVKTDSQGMIGPLEHVAADAADTLSRLVREAADDLKSEARFDDMIHFEPAVDLRYDGQSFEISIPLPTISWHVSGGSPPDDVPLHITDLQASFSDAHQRLYGYRSDERIELVAVRLRSTCRGVPPEIDTQASEVKPTDGERSLGPRKEIEQHRMTRAWINGGWQDTPIIRRNELRRDVTYSGPAIVVEDDATMIIGEGDRIQVDGFGHLIVEVHVVTAP